MQRVLVVIAALGLLPIISVAQEVEEIPGPIKPSAILESKYILFTNTRGDIANGGSYDIALFDVNPGEEYSVRVLGDSTASNAPMFAAFYSSQEIGLDTYLGPAAMNGSIPLKVRLADGDHDLLVVPEGATTIAITKVKKSSLAFVKKGDTFLHLPQYYLSGTLPVMYITTQDSLPVISKDYYLQGTYYFDNNGFDEFESIGSVDNQLPLQIKGRGNASWKMEKKPYRIKLDKKQPLMGLNKNKHFCLMAHYDDNNAFQADEMGFTLSELMDMEWTPKQRPIELVLNGDYVGIYWVAEKIRVDKDRVNIVEQADEETDPYNITGGWLIEIDNYEDPAQIVFTEGNGNILRVTYHTPEVLSTEQEEYLTNMITTIDSLIYVKDKNDTKLWDYIDLDELVKFYILQEVLDNNESFSGSCYWHKERGEDTKLKIGPVWDFGTIGGHWRQDSYNYFIYEKVQDYVTSHWIGEICKFPLFQQKVREVWATVYPDKLEEMHQHCLNYVDYITPAIAADYKRWDWEKDTNIPYRKNRIWTILGTKWEWLNEQWTQPFTQWGDVNVDGFINSSDVSAEYEALMNGEINRLTDINRDGEVNAGDISELYQIILSSPSEEPEE